MIKKQKQIKKPFVKNNQQNTKKYKKQFIGNLHVQAKYKNTILYLTNKKGKLIKQISTKSLKKTTFKKNTPYNIQLIVNKINNILKLKRISKLNLIFKGNDYGRRHVMKNLTRDIHIPYMFRKKLIPFNGCRIRKKKRR